MVKTLPLDDMKKRLKDIQDHNYVYIYGAKYTGKPCTAAEIDAYRRQNSQVYTTEYYNESIRKGVGRYAIDCSGLVCRVWGISDIGSWQIADLPATNPQHFQSLKYSASSPITFGDCVWKEGHVGFVTDPYGDYEASSLAQGVGYRARGEHKWQKIIRPLFPAAYDYPNTGWIHENTGRWWYAYGHNRGDFYANEVVKIGNETFAFDGEGWLLKTAICQTNDRGNIIAVTGGLYLS